MSLLNDLVSELQGLVETYEGASEITVAAGATPTQINTIAREIYRIVRYPNGPTAKKYAASLIEGKDFSDEEVRNSFIELVNNLIG